MKNKALLIMSCAVCFLAGCWDSQELNKRSIWLGTGLDIGEEDSIEVSGEIVIPGNLTSTNGGSSDSKGFIIVSDSGKNVGDVLQKLEGKLSRKAFTGQRRVIIIGEELARRGLQKELDYFSRAPQVGIRNHLFIVKGGTAKSILNLQETVEKTPTMAAMKKHQNTDGVGDTALLNFFITTNSAGTSPTIPAIQLSNIEGDKESLEIAGLAILNRELKLVGFLNDDEKKDFQWITGKLKNRAVSLSHNEGNTSINLTKINSSITPQIHSDKTSFKIKLEGKGYLYESNTDLNIDNTDNLKQLEKQFKNEIHEKVLQTITTVQENYGTDIFGFGEVLHRKHPQQWKKIKEDWDETFKDLEISLEVNISIEHAGLLGPSLLTKESEIRE